MQRSTAITISDFKFNELSTISNFAIFPQTNPLTFGKNVFQLQHLNTTLNLLFTACYTYSVHAVYCFCSGSRIDYLYTSVVDMCKYTVDYLHKYYKVYNISNRYFRHWTERESPRGLCFGFRTVKELFVWINRESDTDCSQTKTVYCKCRNVSARLHVHCNLYAGKLSST